jgi:hypothetical protein
MPPSWCGSHFLASLLWQNRHWPLCLQITSMPSPASSCYKQPECSSYVANQPNLSRPLLVSTTAIHSSLNRGPNRQSPIHFTHGPSVHMTRHMALPQLLVYKKHVLTSPSASRSNPPFSVCLPHPPRVFPSHTGRTRANDLILTPATIFNNVHPTVAKVLSPQDEADGSYFSRISPGCACSPTDLGPGRLGDAKND